MNGNEEVQEVLKSPTSPIGEPSSSVPPINVTPASFEQCETETGIIELGILSKVTAVELEAVRDAEEKDCRDDESAHPVAAAEVDGGMVKGKSIAENECKEEVESLVASKKDDYVTEGEVQASVEADRKNETVKVEELTPDAEEHKKSISETETPAVEEKEEDKETGKVEELPPVTVEYGESTSEGGNDASCIVKAEEVPPVTGKSGQSSDGQGVDIEAKSEDLNGEEVRPLDNLYPVFDSADGSKGEPEDQTVAVKQDNVMEGHEETAQLNERSTELVGNDQEMEDGESQEMDDLQPNGDDSLQGGTDKQLTGDEEIPAPDTEMEIEEDTESDAVKSVSGGKKKLARNSKSHAKTPSRKTIGEDVCFICLDGGELVLCDRRGCPKAYHPSCVNRDEAFFRTKGRWNCGWHICSKCQKNAYYLCYTCAFSLCKGCIKDAEFSCIRGNRGLCETCMKTVMLIEKNDQGNDVMAIFNDETTWEYLFKDYWMEVKEKLALTSDELALAKNPWKGSAAGVKKETHAGIRDGGGSGSDTSLGNVEASNVKAKKTKTKKQVKSSAGGADSDTDSSSGKPDASPAKRKTKRRLKSQSKEVHSDSDYSSVNHDRNANQRKKAKKLSKSHAMGGDMAESGGRGSSHWASKELLDFVMHMKNGDKSVLSQFDVQELLLEYIKSKKLRDPRRRSQIVCDPMLERLFGKPRVGHFEMLKLLESHFLLKDDAQGDDNQGSAVDNEDADVNVDLLADAGKPRGKKLRRRGSDRGLQSNMDDYAAIDMHNISLIYLRRNLMEALIEDSERFHDKVVGCFVRIRISGSTQKQDIYRLVQVTGTNKSADPYKVGKRTTDDMLEILNLDKTEVISIDTISNQEFTEDECKRLRQSIKCGLISRLTVGDILEKAKEIHAIRVKDWLETETQRISHLRDRASDLGRKKELRECVEKLQLLKTPEERQRRLDEIPEVHADPNMDPNHDSENESEADDKNKAGKRRGYEGGFFRRDRDKFSSRKGGSDFNDSWSASATPPTRKWEMSRNLSGKGFSSRRDDSVGAGGTSKRDLWNQGAETNTLHLSSGEKPRTAVDTVTGKEAEYSGMKSNMSPAALESSQHPIVAEPETKISETEKLWHYRDPSAKVQGPFSLTQLRKWSNTGYFPSDLQIWRTTLSEDESIFLTEALAGRFQKGPSLVGARLSGNQGLRISHVLPASTGNPQSMSSQLAANTLGSDTLRINQNLAGGNVRSSLASSSPTTPAIDRSLSDISSKGGTASLGDRPSFSSNIRGPDYVGKYDSSNLPSPTPNRSNKSWNASQSSESRWSSSVPYQRNSEVLASPTTASPEGRHYTNASNVASNEPVRRAQQSSREAAVVPSVGTGPSYSASQGAIANPDNSYTSTPANAQHVASQTIGAIHPVGGQNLMNYNQGWDPSYPNPMSSQQPNPMPAQQPTYGQWSNGNTPASYNAGQAAQSGNLPAVNFQGVPSPNAWGPQSAAAPQNMPWAVTAPTNPVVASNPHLNMGWVGTGQGVSPAGAAFGPSPGQVVGASGGQTTAPTPGAQGPTPGNTSMVWPNTAQASSMGNTGQGWVAPPGNSDTWGNDQNRNGDGNSWNRQSSFGRTGGNPPGTSTSKGQRLCRFHESGHCKKGASCDYMHS